MVMKVFETYMCYNADLDLILEACDILTVWAK